MARWNDVDRTPLAMLRAKAGYTQAEASVLMHIGMISLARYENGVNDITFTIGEKMAELYKVSFEDIRQAVIETKKMKEDSSKEKTSKRKNSKLFPLSVQ